MSESSRLSPNRFLFSHVSLLSCRGEDARRPVGRRERRQLADRETARQEERRVREDAAAAVAERVPPEPTVSQAGFDFAMR